MKWKQFLNDPMSYLYLFAATLPFFMVSPWQTIFGAPVGFLSAAIFMIFIILSAAQHRINISRIIGNDRTKIAIAILAFLMFETVSTILNWSTKYTLTYSQWAVGLKAPHIYNIFLLAFMVFNILVLISMTIISDKKKAMHNIIKIYLVSSLIACIYGIMILFGYEAGLNTPQLYRAAGGIPARLHATATEPQVFASFLLTSLPMAFILFITGTSILNKWLFRITMFIMMISLYLTFGIMGWVGMAAGAASIIYIPKHIKIKMIWEFVAILLLVAFSVNIMTAFTKTDYSGGLDFALNKLRFWELSKRIETYRKADKPKIDIFDDKRVYAGNDTKLDRYWMAIAAINMFKAHPLLGVGTGNYAFLYNDYRPKDAPIKPHMPKPHNSYLEILAEAGIFGFISFILFLFFILIKIVSAMPSMKESDRIYIVGLLACYTALLISGLSLGIFAHTYSWFILGLLLSYGATNK